MTNDNKKLLRICLYFSLGLVSFSGKTWDRLLVFSQFEAFFGENFCLNNLADYYEECMLDFDNGQLHIFNLNGETHFYE